MMFFTSGSGLARWISVVSAVLVAAVIAGVFVFATEAMKPDAAVHSAAIEEDMMTTAAIEVNAQPAGGFRMCNKTQNRVGVAVGYKQGQGWATEGWWNMPLDTCKTLLPGPLISRYYYVYAVDYDEGGEWRGDSFMCTKDREFTIRNIDDCMQRGYDKTGFFEIDTGEQKSWTVQLTEPTQQGIGGR